MVQLKLIKETNTRRDEIANSKGGETVFIDITPYLLQPQSKVRIHIRLLRNKFSKVAKMIGIPPSTLSKRWKEASFRRQW